MKKGIILLCSLLNMAIIHAITIQDITSTLESHNGLSTTAQFTVSMPQLSDDVVYQVRLDQRANQADTLLGCDYIIDWKLVEGGADMSGFNAYFSGNHYRHNGQRLQEYHYATDCVSFRPSLIGSSAGGVHRTAQFVNLLPTSIAAKINEIAAGEGWQYSLRPDTLVSGVKRVGLKCVQRIDGVVSSECEYIFSRETLLPVRISIENNPGSISEQSISVVYGDWCVTAQCKELSEEELMQTYPTVFELYRQSSFRIDNLPGTQLPGFALPTTTGERYQRMSGERFNSPTLMAILDCSQQFTPGLIAAVREAVEMTMQPVDVIWVFVDNNIDRIEPLIGQIRVGEHALINGRSLARDCGAAQLPALIGVGRDGKVGFVKVGFNKDMVSDVIQHISTIK